MAATVPKRLAILATAIGVATGGLTAAPAWSAPTQPQGTTTAAALVWTACDDPDLQEAGAQCTFVSAPLDYGNSTGTQIKLAVSRILHKTPQSQGIMVVNPGGPGGSGLSLVTVGASVPKGAGDAYDWIGFDPRGVGASLPRLQCDGNIFAGPRPEYVPTTPAQEQFWLQRMKDYTAKCAANGPILQHMTTIDSARDMETIRAALGENKLNYYGFSYGTYLGQVYSSLFPQRVRRMVFDSTVDPRNVWYKTQITQELAFDRNMKLFFGWMATYDNVYHLGATGDIVEKRWYDEQAKLGTAPAGGVVGPADFTDIFLNAAYRQRYWTDLANTFATWANDRNPSELVAWYDAVASVGDDNLLAVYSAVQCTDNAWPSNWQTWKNDAWATHEKAPFDTWGNTWFSAPCLTWPAPAQRPATIDGTRVPGILIVGETLDAATPFPGSIEVRRLYPRASLIALPGGTTHTSSLRGNACVDDRIADYLLTGALPARKAGNQADLECAPLPLPDPTAKAKASDGRPESRLGR
jgi:pimeloyl-ACP methyl ester carboxylesterase